MRILGIDYGDVRTGFALSDPSGFLASPIGYVSQTNTQKLTEHISELVKTHNIKKIVLGFPKNMNNTIGQRAEKTLKLKLLLEEAVKLEVILIDERSTTKSAHLILNETNTRGKKRKAAVDTLSAVLILQTYLDSK